MSGVRKIGVLRANSLGDYLFAVPALEALRAAYPSAELVLLGAPWHARTLAHRPGPVDRVVVVPALSGVRDPEPGEGDRNDALMAALRAERFDVAVQLHGGGRHSNPLVHDLNARLTVGLRAEDAPPLDRWVRYAYLQPEVLRYLEVVRLLGAEPVSLTPTFALTPADVDEASRVLREPGDLDDRAGQPSRPIVALHPGASDPRRRWPADRFAAVGNALAASGSQIVLTGINAERDVLAQVQAELYRPARCLVDALTVGGLAALYARCALVVANDTGPLHLAAAVGTPTVGVYWIGNFINGAPFTRGAHRPIPSWTVHCPRCGADCTADLHPARGGRGCTHTDSFVADIPAVEVIEAATDLLARNAAVP